MAITPTVLNSDYVTASTAHAARVRSLSPVVYYKLDEASGTTADDKSGNAYDGTIAGTPELASITSPQGDSVMWFDGTDDEVTAPAGLLADIDDADTLSISFWCAQRSWLHRWSSSVGDSAQTLFYMDSATPSNLLSFTKTATDRQWRLSFVGSASKTVNVNYTGGIGHHAWIHWVITLDAANNEASIYANGNLIDRDDMNSATWDSGALDELRIGAGNGGTNFWNGAICDFAIFESVLTPTDVRNLFTHGLQLSETGETWVTWPESMNAGTTAATDLATVQTAVDGLTAGDVLFIRAGTYGSSGTDQLDIDTASGTADAPILIAGYPGEDADINAVVNVDQDYIWLWGLGVKSATNSTALAGIHYNQDGTGTSVGSRIINCWVRSVLDESVIKSFSSSYNSVISGCVLIAGTDTPGTDDRVHVIYTQNDASNGTKWIHGCALHDAAGGANSDNMKAERNTSGAAMGGYDMRYLCSVNGAFTCQGNAVDLGSWVISDCILHDGIFSFGASSHHDATITDNIIYTTALADVAKIYWPDIDQGHCPTFTGNTIAGETAEADMVRVFSVDGSYATGSTAGMGTGTWDSNTYVRPWQAEIEVLGTATDCDTLPELRDAWSDAGRASYDTFSTELFKSANEAYFYRSPCDPALALLYVVNYTGSSTEDVVINLGHAWAAHDYDAVTGASIDSGADGAQLNLTGLSAGVTTYVIKLTM